MNAKDSGLNNEKRGGTIHMTKFSLLCSYKSSGRGGSTGWLMPILAVLGVLATLAGLLATLAFGLGWL